VQGEVRVQGVTLTPQVKEALRFRDPGFGSRVPGKKRRASNFERNLQDLKPPTRAGRSDGSERQSEQFSIEEQPLYMNEQRFRGGLVLKAHRLCVSPTLSLRIMKKKKNGGVPRKGFVDLDLGSRAAGA